MIRMSEMLPNFSWWNKSLDKKTEVAAAVVGTLLVIPQGITFAYLTGVPTEHGIFCAIFVTFIAALFGNSILMCGPNTATSILIGLSVAPLAARETALFIDYVMILSLMVGVIQLLVWLLRGSKVFEYITVPAISGLTMAVGVLIMRSSVDGVFGLPEMKSRYFFEKMQIVISDWNQLVNVYALIVGLTTIVSGFVVQKIWPKLYVLMSLSIGTLLAFTLKTFLSHDLTQLSYLGELKLDGLQWAPPKLGADYLDGIKMLIPAAFSIAFLSLSQTLVIAKDLKIRKDIHIKLSKEVFAIGIANVIGSLLMSFAGSGSFNRTQANEEAGAKTPLAGLLTGVGVLVVVFVVGDIFSYVPMAVITGVLFIVGYKMIKWKKIKDFAKRRFDLFVFSTVLLTVLFIGLSEAIVAAILLSILTVVKESMS